MTEPEDGVLHALGAAGTSSCIANHVLDCVGKLYMIMWDDPQLHDRLNSAFKDAYVAALVASRALNALNSIADELGIERGEEAVDTIIWNSPLAP